MDVSIIIVNYNTTRLLLDAIDSVFEKTESIEYEIIVVNNNSSDNPQNILAEKYGNKVIYIRLPKNIGFGRANNEGARIAKGRNLFLLNSDTVLVNNAVKILSDYLDNNSTVGCCGGNLVDANGRPNQSFRRFIGYSILDEFNKFFCYFPEKVFYGKNRFYNHTKKPLNAGYIIGADLMIRKSLFLEIKGFDPDFFMYFEETELEYRIKNLGYRIISLPNAIIKHLGSKSFKRQFDKSEKFYASRIIFLQKTQSPEKIRIINRIFYFTVKSRLLIWGLLGNKEKVAQWSCIKRLIITPPI